MRTLLERPRTLWPSSWQALARHAFVIGLAGAISGLLVGGMGGRLVMRASSLLSPSVSGTGARSEQGFRVGEVTLEGTIELVVFIGLIGGIVGAVVYAVTRPWLIWAGRWQGLLFGVFLFLIGSATSDVLNPDNPDFFILDGVPLIVAMFIALFLAFGVVIRLFHRWLDRRLPSFDDAGPLLRLEYLLALAFSPVLAVGLVGSVLFAEDSCGCDPPIVAGGAFMTLLVVSVAIWVIDRFVWGRGATSTLRLLGWLALLVAATAGGFRAVSDVISIVT